MNQTRVLFAAILMVAMVALPAGANTWHYTFPANLNLDLKLSGQEAKALRLTATIESLVGVLSDVELFFESSADLKVLPGSAQLKTLPQGEKRKFALTVTATAKSADQGGSWVRLRAVYLPAYRDIAQILSDAKVYPDPFERRRILQRVAENQAKKARQTDATRFFPENFPPQAP